MLTQSFHIIYTRHHDKVTLQLFIEISAIIQWGMIEIYTLTIEFKRLLFFKDRLHQR